MPLNEQSGGFNGKQIEINYRFVHFLMRCVTVISLMGEWTLIANKGFKKNVNMKSQRCIISIMYSQ